MRLISSDNHVFVLRKECALASGTIKAMMSGPGAFHEDEINEVFMREIP